MERRVIVTPRSHCENSCTDCYLKGRPDKGSRVDLFEVTEDCSNIAIGWNNPVTQADTYLAKKYLLELKNLVITTRYNKYLKNTIVRECKTWDIYPELISVSVDEYNIDNALYSFGDSTAWYSGKIGFSILDTCNPVKIIEALSKKEIYKYYDIYLIMKKGIVPQWKMTEACIDGYLSIYGMYRVSLGNIVLTDSCVYSILSEDSGNCCGRWIEVDYTGGIRVCPHSKYPDMYTLSGVPELGLDKPLCRML